MLSLREYQRKAVQSVFDYLAENPGKNPCLVLPTGSGKSVCVAAFVMACLEWWPDSRVLVVTHQKELVEQDAKTLHRILPGLSIGIYSAAMGSKDLSQPVTFASIQSIYRTSIPDIRFLLIDEAHLINNESKGMYRTMLSRSRARVIGLTATPYRMGQGYLTDGDGIFDDLIEPVSILELQGLGFLAKLRNKGTFTKLDVSGMHLRGGEFISSELQERNDTFETNEAVCDEIIRSAEVYGRRHILVFCTGVEHAAHVAGILNEKGMAARDINGTMDRDTREEILYQFTHGSITALTNVDLLTTGFDFPDIDMICMLRPTMSPGLYLQMAGRGLRLKSDGGDCLVLDFAGNVTRHGPIAFVAPPRKKGEGKGGVAPCKECPQCLEIVPLSLAVCPSCGYVFPRESLTWILYEGDVNGDNYEKHECWKWVWYITESRKNAIPMIVCECRTNDGAGIERRFYCIWHEGWIGSRAQKDLMELGARLGAPLPDDWDDCIHDVDEVEGYIQRIEAMEHPSIVITKRSETNHRYRNIVRMLWDKDIEAIRQQAEREREVIENARKNLLGR